ncbi:hypothetical protein B0T14DRAFT_431209, partial [Immersiella caudata]
DTVCIDKTSSAELSEAISKYAWYARSAACFAYLEDVADRRTESQANRGFRPFTESPFTKSR